MALAYGSAGAASAPGTTSLSIAYPSSIAVGDLLVLAVVCKLPTVTPTTPSGWTLRASQIGGNPNNNNSISNGGRTKVLIYTKVADGTESGSISLSIPSGNSAGARILRYSGSGNYSFASSGDDFGYGFVSATTISIETGSLANLNLAVDDIALIVYGSNSARIDFGQGTLVESGITFSSASTRSDVDSDKFAVGNNCSLMIVERTVTAGTANTTPVATLTNSSFAADDPHGALIVFRMRESVPVVPVKRVSLLGREFPGTRFTRTSAIRESLSSRQSAIVSSEFFPSGTRSVALTSLSASGTAAQAAQVSLTLRVFASANGIASQSANATVTSQAVVQLTCAASGTSAQSADILITRQAVTLTADSTGIATQSVDLVITRQLASVTSGSSTQALNLSVTSPISTSASGSATQSVDAIVTRTLSAQVSGSSVQSATLTRVVQLDGDAVSDSTALADTLVSKGVQLLSASTSEAVAVLGKLFKLVGTAEGLAANDVDLLVVRNLRCDSTGLNQSNATLQSLADIVVIRNLVVSSNGYSSPACVLLINGINDSRGDSMNSASSASSVASKVNQSVELLRTSGVTGPHIISVKNEGPGNAVVGCFIKRSSDGQVLPAVTDNTFQFKNFETDNVADGIARNFAETTLSGPIVPGSVSIGLLDPVKDDGNGQLQFKDKGAILFGTGGTFATMAGETVSISVDGQPARLINFGTENTLDKAITTLNQYLAAVNAVAEKAGTQNVNIRSLNTGIGSSVEITAVDAGAVTKLGLHTGKASIKAGTVNYLTGKIDLDYPIGRAPLANQSGKAVLILTGAPWNLANGDTFVIATNGGADQNVTFATADFPNIAAVTPAQLKTKLASVTGLSTEITGVNEQTGLGATGLRLLASTSLKINTSSTARTKLGSPSTTLVTAGVAGGADTIKVNYVKGKLLVGGSSQVLRVGGLGPDDVLIVKASSGYATVGDRKPQPAKLICRAERSI